MSPRSSNDFYLTSEVKNETFIILLSFATKTERPSKAATGNNMSQKNGGRAGGLSDHKGENAPQENENTPADRDSPQVRNGHITQGNTANTPQDDLATDHEVALHLGLPPPEPLDSTSGNVSENWTIVKCHKRSYAANRHWQRYHECF